MVGNDAAFDRLTIGLGVVWLLTTGVLIALHRAPGGLRAQIRRERQQWREMRTQHDGDDSDR